MLCRPLKGYERLFVYLDVANGLSSNRKGSQVRWEDGVAPETDVSQQEPVHQDWLRREGAATPPPRSKTKGTFFMCPGFPQWVLRYST